MVKTTKQCLLATCLPKIHIPIQALNFRVADQSKKSSGPRLVLCFGEAFTKVGLAGDTWCQLLKATPFFLMEILCSTLLVGWLQMFSIHLHGILWMLVAMNDFFHERL